MSTGLEDRALWVKTMDRLVRPVLSALSQRRLKILMPVEISPSNRTNRATVTHLEALGRSLAGLSPWIELGADASDESKLRGKLADLARGAIDAGTDPKSPDFLNFTEHNQPLVDAAFLAHAIIRSPKELWGKLAAPTRANLVAALQSTRLIKPGMNNWVLFSAMVEAALFFIGERWKPDPVDFALTNLMDWYKGDGLYGDGKSFHWDYYNSFVIHPMLIDVIDTVGKTRPEWSALRQPIMQRAVRYAAIQEKLISPEGTFPAIGRSLAYRFGAFQLLGQMTLRRQLPAELSPGQVRCGLTAMIRRMIEAPGTFDANGFLTIGFCGHQATIAEDYISTGSLYLCTVGLLPLGLPASDEFWTCGPADWSAKVAWSDAPVSPDHSIA